MDRITVPARVDSLHAVNDFLREKLEECACPREILLQIRLALEEVFVNISSYAYRGGEGNVEVRCCLLEEPRWIEIRILDRGELFDPLSVDPADTSEEALLAREGGLGILLVCGTMDDVKYRYEDGKNVLTIIKKL